MQTRRIGSLAVTVVGVGCNNFGGRLDEAGTRAVVHAALDAGIHFFDTADIYGGAKSEELLGRALGRRRDDVVVATKFGFDDGARPDAVRRACEDSLRRLGTDRIDLYQLHRPDEKTPIADTLLTLDRLVEEGKVREIGCSQFSVEQMREAGGRFASVQNEYSLLHRAPERDVLPECSATRTAFLPFFPLSNGLLTGKYADRARGATPQAASRLATDERLSARTLTSHNLATAQSLADYAASRGHTLLELAVSWLLREPVVASVIAGAMTAEQVRANAAAASWALTASERADVDRIAPVE